MTGLVKYMNVLVKEESESLKVPFDKGDLGGSVRISHSVPIVRYIRVNHK